MNFNFILHKYKVNNDKRSLVLALKVDVLDLCFCS